jgi:hypothetical protein
VRFEKVLVKCLCIGLCALFTTLAGAKPLSPIQVSIMPANTPAQGQPVQFVVRATVTMDADNVHILVSVPESLQVLDGELQWQGPLSKGQETFLRFSVILSESSTALEEAPLIQVQAAVLSGAQFGGNQGNALGRLAASAHYVWQTGLANVAASSKTSRLNSRLKSRVVKGNGITVHEFELRP